MFKVNVLPWHFIPDNFIEQKRKLEIELCNSIEKWSIKTKFRPKIKFIVYFSSISFWSITQSTYVFNIT